MTIDSLKKRKDRSLKRLKSCTSVFQAIGAMFLHDAQQLLNDLYPEKYLIEITDGYRSNARQNKLFKEGKTKARGSESYHNYGIAMDLAVLDIEGGFYEWGEVESPVDGIARSPLKELGEKWVFLYGGTWGGNWENFVDQPHFQLDYGLSLTDLRWGKGKTNELLLAKCLDFWAPWD